MLRIVIYPPDWVGLSDGRSRGKLILPNAEQTNLPAFDSGPTRLGELLRFMDLCARKKLPRGFSPDPEKTVTAKADVILCLKRSFDAVKTAHASVSAADIQRKVKIFGRDATVDGMYLRILVHANEHMGQLVAYARMNGVTPPWSESAGK